jgi:hypothetical protein
MDAAHETTTVRRHGDRPSPLGRHSLVDRGRKLRSKRTNDPLSEIKGHTAQGRRLADLVRAHLQKLGDPSDVQLQAAVIAAAELQVLCEKVRSEVLAMTPPNVDMLDQLIRLESLTARSLRRLGLDKPPKPNEGPSLADYLASHPSRQAAE